MCFSVFFPHVALHVITHCGVHYTLDDNFKQELPGTISLDHFPMEITFSLPDLICRISGFNCCLNISSLQVLSHHGTFSLTCHIFLWL